jgi:hypothetical protein
MALTQVTGPYPIFTDLDGTPLDDGYLYIGEVNQDPETNPVQVYWDSALTIAATQPIRTNSGYAYRNGTPALIYTAGAFSITIRNKREEFVLYSPVGYGFDPAAVSGAVVQNDFTGDGTTVAFTLSSAPSTKLATSVFINGVYQEKSTYSVTGNVLTFTVAPPFGSGIEVMTNETGVIGSTNASLVSYTAGFSGAVAQTVQTKLEQYISVKDFGAVGDGVADDTAEIQAALTYAATQNAVVLVPYGTYILSSTLTANATLIFDGGIFEMSHTIKLNGDADLIGRNGGGITFGNGTGYIGHTPNNYDTQILCGLDATWTGCISGMTFRVDNIDYCYLISLWNCDGAKVSENTLVDFNINNGGSLIGAPNSSTAITGTNTRSQKNCSITGNSIKFAVGFTGGQLFGAYESEGIIISNNNCYGGGDDILNADRSSGIMFNNNYISTRVGTVIINNTDNFSVSGNTIIKEDVGSGYDPSRAILGGILLVPTDPTQTFVAKNGVVSNNTIINNSVENMPQPLLVAGVENVIVSNNVLVNKKANADFTLGVNNSGSVVPTLLPIIYNRNLVVRNNLIVNGKMLFQVAGGTSADGVIATGNVANGGGYATTSMNLQGFSNTRNDFAADNIGIGATTQAQNLNNDGIGFNPRTLLNVFTATAVTTNTNLKAVGNGTYLYVPAATALDQVTIQFSAATSAACVINLYTYNGTTDTLVGTLTLASGTKSKNATATDEGVKLSTVIVPTGNAVKFLLTTAGLTSVDVSVNLYGSKFAFN